MVSIAAGALLAVPNPTAQNIPFSVAASPGTRKATPSHKTASTQILPDQEVVLLL